MSAKHVKDYLRNNGSISRLLDLIHTKCESYVGSQCSILKYHAHKKNVKKKHKKIYPKNFFYKKRAEYGSMGSVKYSSGCFIQKQVL